MTLDLTYGGKEEKHDDCIGRITTLKMTTCIERDTLAVLQEIEGEKKNLIRPFLDPLGSRTRLVDPIQDKVDRFPIPQPPQSSSRVGTDPL